MQDDARHEAPHATKQAKEGEEALLESIGKTHNSPTDTRSETNEYPHYQNDVLLKSTTVGAIIVLIEEVEHEWRTNQGYACPKPCAPVFIPHQKGDKLCKQDNNRRIAPSQKEILASQVLATHDLATHTSDNIQFLCRIHKGLSLYFKQYNANI